MRPDPGTVLQRLPPLFGAVVRPIQAFFQREAASGILLLAAAAAALVWVNVLDEASYRDVVHAPIVVTIAGAQAQLTLLQLINEGLMTIFFFVVGMEIKRELVVGELSSFRTALLPAIAALGGMIVPAGVFIAFNHGGPGARGWAIPMATDIAFAIGCLTLLRARVPSALVVFVTALAIFDDIGGILVIAAFYGGGLEVGWLLGVLGVGLALYLLGRAGVSRALAYALGGVVLWYSLHHAGVHATIAGVILGLLIPARERRPADDVLRELAEHTAGLRERPHERELAAAEIMMIEERLEELQSPLTRYVHALHPWVAFGVVPLFAFANAGVSLAGMGMAELTGAVALGTGLGLVAGKLVGVFAFTVVASRAGVAPLPGGASAAKLAGVSAIAGIGFTVALFIAGLAFADAPELLDQAKVGILGGSLVAGLTGAAILGATARIPS